MFAATFAAKHLVLTRPACLAFWFSQQRGCPAPTGGGPLAGPLLPATAPRAGGAHGHQRASKVGRKAGRDQPATLQLEGGCGRIFHGQKIKSRFPGWCSHQNRAHTSVGSRQLFSGGSFRALLVAESPCTPGWAYCTFRNSHPNYQLTSPVHATCAAAVCRKNVQGPATPQLNAVAGP